MRALRHILALFQLALPFRLRRPYGLLSTLLNKVFFELVATPYLRSFLLLVNHDPLRPRCRDKGLRHLPQEDVLKPFLMAGSIGARALGTRTGPQVTMRRPIVNLN